MNNAKIKIKEFLKTLDNNDAEELIKTLNPNTLQCKKCKKWFSKGDFNYDYTNFFDVCIKCYDTAERERAPQLTIIRQKN